MRDAATAPAGLGLFLLRIGRRARRTQRELRARLRDGSEAALSAIEFTRRTGLADGVVPAPSEYRTLPGPPSFPAVPDHLRRAAAEQAVALRAHQFDLLGSGRVAVDAEPNAEWRARFNELARELPGAAVQGYRPIDWHRDARSGYRWSPGDYYLDVRVAPAPGVDIKWPRELSRFQHLPALAFSSTGADGEEAVLQVLDWIAANPVRRGVNWASAMDVAIRAVNWIWAVRLLEPVLRSCPHAAWEIHRSLYEHGLHVAENLEYYQEATSNHYLANVAGLLYIGCACPEFPEADGWVRFGLQELVSEMERQVLSDGADFEASTHYHRLVAEMFASCAALAERLSPARRRRVAGVRGWRGMGPAMRAETDCGLSLRGSGRVLPSSFYASLARMAAFTAALTKPNGLVPQFGDNDSARLHKLSPLDGDSRDHRHLVATVQRLLSGAIAGDGDGRGFESEAIAGGLPPGGPALTAADYFRDAGIAVLRAGAAWLAVTCGPNGQSGRGGHGHNDKLSFELHVAGHDIVADGGCLVYTADPVERNRFRSTAAHSTIFVAGMEQDPIPPGMAGLFRLPQRAARRLDAPVGQAISGFHDGFGAPHRRTWTLDEGSLIIEDRIEFAGDRWISFNFDPGVSCEITESGESSFRAELHASGVRLSLEVTGARDPEVAPGAFSSGYGERRANQRLCARLHGDRCRSVLEWSR